MINRTVLIISIGLMCNPFYFFSQDSITPAIDVTEKNQLKFQEYFFKALSEKAISNYKASIQNLELCTTIDPENKTVYFELSKNYLLLNKTIEAKQYIEKALIIEPTNIWMLLHLVSIQKKDRNFNEAIKTLIKISQQNPSYKEELIRLYYLNKEYSKALQLLDSIEKQKGLPKSLKQLKQNLELRKTNTLNKELKDDLPSLISDFEENRTSFLLLKKILEIAIKTDKVLFYKYSQLAIDLFPAQPIVYMYRGEALDMQNKHQEAIDVLEVGIDFVIDNPTLESQFYSILANIYKKIKNLKKSLEYMEKAKISSN